MVVSYMFSFESVIRGYHECRMIRNNPIAGEELPCYRELGNSHDPYAVAVKKFIAGEQKVVGHIPRRISAICSLFIRTGGDIHCQVSGDRRYSSDLLQGGLEIPAVLFFTAAKRDEGQKTKKLIEDTLDVKVTVSEARSKVHTPSSLSPTTKELAIKTETERDIIEEEDVINLTEPDAELPVAKKAKVFDGERIIMGQQLSDVEINFAQQLLKEQFPKVNGLTNTLYQEKRVERGETSVLNKLQIVHCKIRQHWIVASTFGCSLNEVKVYDSLFYNCDNETEHVIANLFQCGPNKVTVKVAYSQKQSGSSDCGVYAIAFATAVVNGLNPSRLKFKQEVMRSYLVNCFTKKHISPFPLC